VDSPHHLLRTQPLLALVPEVQELKMNGIQTTSIHFKIKMATRFPMQLPTLAKGLQISGLLKPNLNHIVNFQDTTAST
jgi:hypothetical protein